MFSLLARIAGVLTRLVGWSILGKRVALYSAEGPEEELINTMVGEVVSCSKVFGSQQLKVSLDDPILFGDETLDFIYLTPRHINYDSNASLFFPIAVIVLDNICSDNNSAMGMAMMKII